MDILPIASYLDVAGRVTAWPSKRNNRHKQGLVLQYLATYFQEGRTYSEAEVNAVIKQHHTFGDHALLRRELVERGFLRRTRDCSQYWRETSQSPIPREMRLT